MISTTVTLTKVETIIAKFIAKARYRANRKQHVFNAKIGGQSNELTDLEGVAAELAFSKLFNCYPKETLIIKPQSAQRQEDYGDVVLANGLTVDVKATTYHDGRMLAAIWKPGDSVVDCYALMVGKCPTYTFKGFMRSNELLKSKRIINLGHGPTHAAWQHELVELEDLDKIVPIQLMLNDE